MTGTSSASSASACHSSPACEPPDASTVVTSASIRPSSSRRAGASPRSEYAQTQTGWPPASSIAAASASTNAVLPDTRCER